MTAFHYAPSPLGTIYIERDARGLTSVHLSDSHDPSSTIAADPLLAEATTQLGAYFDGRLQHFDLPLAPCGTPFQQRVWQALTRIPYGATRSYLDIAMAVGNPKAVRAVGAANGRNPWWIIVPCHRVIGSNGKLTGYAGGLAVKRWLLQHEAWHPAAPG